MSVAERCHDPGWVPLRVYDDHQPKAWSYVLLEEPLSVRPGVCFSMIRRGDCFEHRPEMGSSSTWPLCGSSTCRSHVSSKSTTCMPSGVAVSARMVRRRVSGLSVKGAGCRGVRLGRGAQQGYLPDRIRDGRRKLGRRSCSLCPHERQRLRRPFNRLLTRIARFRCDTIFADGRAELPERLFTMAYRRPGFAEPLA